MKAKLPNLTQQQKAEILGDGVPQPDLDARAAATNPLAGLHIPCADSARKLISLWDMNQIIAREFLAAWMLLEHEITKAEKVGNQQQIATEAERDALVRALIEVHYQCGRMGFVRSEERRVGKECRS